MKQGDRVRLRSSVHDLGTVIKVSPAGYTTVSWDDDPHTEQFSPVQGRMALVRVTGDDAVKRHTWEYVIVEGASVVRCANCLVLQTDENEFAPCA